VFLDQSGLKSNGLINKNGDKVDLCKRKVLTPVNFCSEHLSSNWVGGGSPGGDCGAVPSDSHPYVVVPSPVVQLRTQSSASSHAHVCWPGFRQCCDLRVRVTPAAYTRRGMVCPSDVGTGQAFDHIPIESLLEAAGLDGATLDATSDTTKKQGDGACRVPHGRFVAGLAEPEVVHRTCGVSLGWGEGGSEVEAAPHAHPHNWCATLSFATHHKVGADAAFLRAVRVLGCAHGMWCTQLALGPRSALRA
jgi:hypothetical protein